MSQFNFGTIDPDTKSGSTLASDLNSWRDALHSCHKGAGRPSYAIAGMIWAKDVSGTQWDIYIYDGNGDTLLGVFNPTTDAWIPYRAGAAITDIATSTAGAGVKVVSGALVARLPVSAKAGSVTLGTGDRATTAMYSGTGTIAFSSAGTLGNDWFCYVSALNGTVTLDPTGAETIDGASTLTLRAGETVLIVCDGTNFYSLGRGSVKDIISLVEDTTAADADRIAIWDAAGGRLASMTRANFLANLGASGTYNEYTTPGSTSWAKPPRGTFAYIEAWGGGGSGGRRSDNGGGGGGGGGYQGKLMRLSSLAASEQVVVGAGGASRNTDGNGSPGGVSSFSSAANLVSGGPGGAGALCPDSPSGAGGGGGGGAGGAAGSNGAQGGAAGSGGFWGGGAGGDQNTSTPAEDGNEGGGGGGGFGSTTATSIGGSSRDGGGGGGGAGNTVASNGGSSLYGGNGGNGSNAAGGTAGSGGVRGGGGGGARGTTGAGGRGEVRVWVF